MGVPVNPAHYTGLVSGNNKGYDDMDAEMDALLVGASQWVESELICTSVEGKLQSLSKENMDRVPVSRFGPLQSKDDIKQIKESRVPKNTRKYTCWALQVWEQWATEWLEKDLESIT